MKLCYSIALVCGAFPLLAGISIFLLWLNTHWNWLMMAGIVTLYGGLVFFAIGSIALICYCLRALRTPGLSKRRILFSTLICAGLLISNFPVAAGIIVAGIALETRYTVVIHNASQQPLEHIQIFGGGCERSIDLIPPGHTVSRSFWFHCDGQLEFCATSGKTTISKIIDGYVTNSMGGYTTVAVNSDKTISIMHDYN